MGIDKGNPGMARKGRKTKNTAISKDAGPTKGGSSFFSVGGSHSELLEIMNMRSSNPQIAGVFSDQHDILLVGEGDFTFALALSVKCGGRRIVATSLDTEREVLDKYPEASLTLKQLKAAKVRVFHGVDVAALGKHHAKWKKAPAKFHRIVSATHSELLFSQCM